MHKLHSPFQHYSAVFVSFLQEIELSITIGIETAKKVNILPQFQTQEETKHRYQNGAFDPQFLFSQDLSDKENHPCRIFRPSKHLWRGCPTECIRHHLKLVQYVED